MNVEHNFNLQGKVLEILKPDDTCFIKVRIEPILIELQCPENCDFHLEDRVVIECEIIVKKLKPLEKV